METSDARKRRTPAEDENDRLRREVSGERRRRLSAEAMVEHLRSQIRDLAEELRQERLKA